MNFTHSIWGEVDVKARSGAYCTAKTTIAGEELAISLFISAQLAEKGALLKAASEALTDIVALEKQARAFLAKTDDSTVDDFGAFHAAELSDGQIEKVFGVGRDQIKREQLMKAVRLHSIAVNLKGEKFTLTFDFKLTPNISDQILAIAMGDTGVPTKVSWES